MMDALSPREERTPALLARPHIVKRIVEPGVLPIVLVIAPAGYGKSTVLDECASALGRHCIRFQVATEHATPAAFVRGFAEALGGIDKGDGNVRIEASERAIRGRLATYNGAIIVDGLQIAQNNAEVMLFLVAMIECSKARVRWILASSSTLGLPIGTWLAYRDCDLPVDAVDLRFSSMEAHEAVRALDLDVESDEIEDVVGYTEGWPAAINVAIRAWARPPAERNLPETIREASHRFLEEQVYAALEDDERDLLAIAAALPEIDVKVLDLAGFERALHLLDTVRVRTGLLREESSGLYRCQALFLDFLRRRTALSGPRVRESVYIRAARALEAAEDIEPALDAYAKAGSRDDLLRVLERCGFDLLERGRTEAASRAIDALDEPTRRGNPRILALRGVLQSLSGNPIRAEAYLRRSLLKAKNDRDLVASVTLRLSLLITNHGGDIAELLVPLADDSLQSAASRAEALSLLAAQRALTGDVVGAEDASSRVDKLLI
jgi:LuxR family maltose regulon positive regulatory protein